MTILQARKILGKDAQGITDSELEHDIEAASFFFNLFIKMRAKEGNSLEKTPLKCHNVAQYGNK